MLRVQAVTALAGRNLRLTLTDGSVVERDVAELLQGPVSQRVAEDDAVFRAARVEGGTVVWPGDVDLAPETLIWDGPEPAAAERRQPPATLRPRLLVG